MRPSPQKKRKIVYLNSGSLAGAVTHAVTYLSSDGAELSDRLFGQNKPFFFFLYVFCGECDCICMISICVADISCDHSD